MLVLDVRIGLKGTLTGDRQANPVGAGQAAIYVGHHQDHEAEFGFALDFRCFMKACVLGKDENSEP